MSPAHRIAAAITVVAAATLLAACTPGVPGSTPTSPAPSASATHVVASPSASPSPSSTALPAGALLRVSGTAVADDGTRVRLVETVTGPTAGDGTEEAAMTAAQCSGSGYDWHDDFPGAIQWLHLDLTTTLLSGTAWPDGDHDVLVSGASGWDTVAWTGAWHAFQAYCASGIAVPPGHATGVAPVVEEDATQRIAWQRGVYGFDWAYDGDPPATPGVTFTDCRLELSSTAQAYAANFPLEAGSCAYGTND